jgi:hypothetical protein
VVRDLQTGAEISLGPAQPVRLGRFLGVFEGTFLLFAERHLGSAPAELHALDLVPPAKTPSASCRSASNWAGWIKRNDDERLLLDSLGHGVFTGKNDLVARRTLNGPLLTPELHPDGKYLIYVAPLPRHALRYDHSGAAHVPGCGPHHARHHGVAVRTAGERAEWQELLQFTDGDKGQAPGFWAHLGRASSDLYFADYQGGALPTGLRLIAKSILSVSDLCALLVRHLEHVATGWRGRPGLPGHRQGRGHVVRASRDPMWSSGGSDLSTSYAAYIVRGRVDSDRSGLWLTTLAPPVTSDGGTD